MSVTAAEIVKRMPDKDASDVREPLLSAAPAHIDVEGNRRGTYTVDEAIDSLGFGKFQVLMLIYAGLAWTGDAMEMAILSFLGPALRCEWQLSSGQQAWLSSVVFAGFLVGAYAWGTLADERGRKVGFFVPAMLTCLAGVASALMPSYGGSIHGRVAGAKELREHNADLVATKWEAWVVPASEKP